MFMDSVCPVAFSLFSSSDEDQQEESQRKKDEMILLLKKAKVLNTVTLPYWDS